MDQFTGAAKNLFQAIPPRDLRKHLQELYFRYHMDHEHSDFIPGLTESVYFLLKFLDEVEEEEEARHSSPSLGKR